jgi:hypothetical protein
MDVIRHEHIGMYQAAMVAGVCAQPMQIELEVLVGEEARLRLFPRWIT